MLRQLHISNYALIENVELHFGKGMTAITGETGSGKSILLGAFGLLLGERVDSKTIKDETKKCVVEAVFDLKGYGLKNFFAQHDLDYEVLTTVRREISLSGKSRAFINDTPVQLIVLKALGSELVDIHSQHENSMLGQRAFQFATTDAFAGNTDLLNKYREHFTDWKQAQKELDNLLTNEARMRQELDYMSFQWQELQKADLENIYQQQMEEQLETLNNAEQIKAQLSAVVQALDSDASGVLVQLTVARSTLQKVGNINFELNDFAKRTESCYLELRELMRDIENYEGNVHVDEALAAQLNDRLSSLYKLQQKHRLQSTQELIGLRNELEVKCGGFENLDEHINKLKGQVEKEKQQLMVVGQQITESRLHAAIKAEANVRSYFDALQLEHAELKIAISPAKDFNEYGLDEIEFLFKANKGGQLLPSKQVASGGEISRVMLALKASISKHKKLPVLILDEIDQGVSGEAGKKIGDVLKEMSREMQLLAITHLPQIAGKAEHHLKVYKKTDAETTSTHVRQIEGEDRINELAEMLSGKSLTKAAIENAKELMAN